MENEQQGPVIPPVSPGESPKPTASPAANATSPGWEREVLEKLAFAALAEQRTSRRWGIFFKFVFVALVIGGGAIALTYNNTDIEASTGEHTALIEIEGDIESGSSGAAEQVIPALDKAYTDDNAVGIIIARVEVLCRQA